MIRWKDGKVDRLACAAEMRFSADRGVALVNELADALDVAVAALQHINGICRIASPRNIAGMESKKISANALLRLGVEHD